MNPLATGNRSPAAAGQLLIRSDTGKVVRRRENFPLVPIASSTPRGVGKQRLSSPRAKSCPSIALALHWEATYRRANRVLLAFPHWSKNVANQLTHGPKVFPFEQVPLTLFQYACRRLRLGPVPGVRSRRGWVPCIWWVFNVFRLTKSHQASRPAIGCGRTGKQKVALASPVCS